MESIPCIFGHGYSEDVVITENGFQGRRCPKCSTIFISPRPNRCEVFDLYHHDKAHVPSSHHLGFNPGVRIAAARHFAALFAKHPFRPKNRPTSMLEIGCGGGHLLKIAKANGIAAHGVELNCFQALYVAQTLGIPCETVEFTRNSFGARRFDIIFHCDVTSHLYDPIGDFTAMQEKLTDDGWLIFETGNGADIDPKYYPYFSAWQYPDHLFFFGEDSIRELLKKSGFSRIHISSRSILPELALLKALRLVAHSGNKPRQPKGKENKHAPDNTNFRGRLARTLVAHALNTVRSSIGLLCRNPKHPRTMLIWAGK